MSIVMFCCSMKVFAGKINLTISPPISMIKIQFQKWACPLLRVSEMKLGHDIFAQTKDNQRTKRNREFGATSVRLSLCFSFMHSVLGVKEQNKQKIRKEYLFRHQTNIQFVNTVSKFIVVTPGKNENHFGFSGSFAEV
jgi:hypothetical protein